MTGPQDNNHLSASFIALLALHHVLGGAASAPPAPASNVAAASVLEQIQLYRLLKTVKKI